MQALPDNSFAEVTAGAPGSEASTDSAAMVAQAAQGTDTDPILYLPIIL